MSASNGSAASSQRKRNQNKLKGLNRAISQKNIPPPKPIKTRVTKSKHSQSKPSSTRAYTGGDAGAQHSNFSSNYSTVSLKREAPYVPSNQINSSSTSGTNSPHTSNATLPNSVSRPKLDASSVSAHYHPTSSNSTHTSKTSSSRPSGRPGHSGRSGGTSGATSGTASTSTGTERKRLPRVKTLPIRDKTISNHNLNLLEESQLDHPHMSLASGADPNSSGRTGGDATTSRDPSDEARRRAERARYKYIKQLGLTSQASQSSRARFQHTHNYTGSRKHRSRGAQKNSTRSHTTRTRARGVAGRGADHPRGSNLNYVALNAGGSTSRSHSRSSRSRRDGTKRHSMGPNTGHEREMSKSRSHSRSGGTHSMAMDDIALPSTLSMMRSRNSRSNLDVQNIGASDDIQLQLESPRNAGLGAVGAMGGIGANAQGIGLERDALLEDEEQQPRFNFEHFNAEDDVMDDEDDCDDEDDIVMDGMAAMKAIGSMANIGAGIGTDPTGALSDDMKEGDEMEQKSGGSGNKGGKGKNNKKKIGASNGSVGSQKKPKLRHETSLDTFLDGNERSRQKNGLSALTTQSVGSGGDDTDTGEIVVLKGGDGYETKMAGIDDNMEHEYNVDDVVRQSVKSAGSSSNDNDVDSDHSTHSTHSTTSAHSAHSHSGVSHQRLKKFGMSKFKLRNRENRSQTHGPGGQAMLPSPGTAGVGSGSGSGSGSESIPHDGKIEIIPLDTPGMNDDEVRRPVTNRAKSHGSTDRKAQTLSPQAAGVDAGPKRSSFARWITSRSLVQKLRRGSHQTPTTDMRLNQASNHADASANSNENNDPNGLNNGEETDTQGSKIVKSKSFASGLNQAGTSVNHNYSEQDDTETEMPFQLSASIVAVRRLADHAEYEIEVSIDSHRWCIYRRYNEFREFDKNLRKIFKSEFQKIPEFPKRTMIPTMNEDLLLKRKQAFNDYVRGLLADPVLAHCGLVLVFFKMDDSPEFLNNQDEWEERWKKHEIVMWECGETSVPYDRSTVLELRLSCENVPLKGSANGSSASSGESGSCLRVYQKERYDDYYNDRRLLMTTDYVIDCKNPRYSRICLFPYIADTIDPAENELVFDLCLSETSDEAVGTTKVNLKHLLCQNNGFVRISIVTDNSTIRHRHSLPNIKKDQTLPNITSENMVNVCIAVTRYRDRRDKNPYQKLPKHQLPSNMKMEPWNSDIQKEFSDLLSMDINKEMGKFKGRVSQLRNKHLSFDYFVTKSKSESETAGHLMLQLWKLLLTNKLDKKFDSSFNRTLFSSMSMIATRYDWDLVHIERWTKYGKNYVPETTTDWEKAMNIYHELCVDSIAFAANLIDTLFDSDDAIDASACDIMPESSRNLERVSLLLSVESDPTRKQEMEQYLQRNQKKKGKRMVQLIEESEYYGELTFIYTMVGIGMIRFSNFRRQCLPLLTEALQQQLNQSKSKRYEKVNIPWQQGFAQTIADEQQKNYAIDSFFSQFNPSVFSKAWVSYVKDEDNEKIKLKTDKQIRFLRKHWLPIFKTMLQLSSKHCHGKMAWQKIDGFSRMQQLLCEMITWTPLRSAESNNVLKYAGELMRVPQMKHELGLFSMALLYNTDAMDPMQVEICFMTLLRWIMDTGCTVQLPDTFCHNTFADGIERVLKYHDYQVICSCLSFILQHSHLFNEKLRKRVLLELLLKQYFDKLFCHWSHNVRKYFHMVLLYCMNRVGYFNEERRKKYIENGSIDKDIIDSGHMLYVQFDHMTRIGPFQGKYKKKQDVRMNIKFEKLKNVTYDPVDFDGDMNFDEKDSSKSKEIISTRFTDMTVKDRFDTDATLAEQLNLTLSQLHHSDKLDSMYAPYVATSFREFAYQCQEYRRIQLKTGQDWKFGEVYVPTLIYHVRDKNVETEFAKKQKNASDRAWIQ